MNKNEVKSMVANLLEATSTLDIGSMLETSQHPEKLEVVIHFEPTGPKYEIRLHEITVFTATERRPSK